MRKYFSILSLILLCSVPMCLLSQFQITFDSRTANAGETIEVDVVVENFDDLISAQFSINWDPAVFSFVSAINPTDLLPEFSITGNLGLPTNAAAVDDGELTFSWSRQNTLEASVADGTILFTIVLDAIGAPCAETTLIVSDTPSQIEVVDVDKNFVNINTSGGVLDIDGSNCDGGNGGGNCDGSTAVSMIVQDVTVEAGESVCIPVIGRNFTDIASVQAAFTWNSNRLSFTSVNGVAIMGDVSSAANAANGELRYLWFDNTAANPISINNGDTLFELCFDVNANEGQTADIAVEDITGFAVEITNSGGVVEHCVQGGTVSVEEGVVEPEDCQTTDNVAFIINDIGAEENTEVCIPVTVRNFTNIAAFMAGLRWDANVLEFDRINGVALTGETPNLMNANNGIIRYLWQDPTGTNPATVPDGGTLFELCFNIIGDVDESTLVEVTSLPNFDVEVANSEGREVPNCLESGVFTVEMGVVEPENCNTTDNVAFIIPAVTAESGSTVCIPITARNFSNIAAFMAGLRWDSDVLEFVNINGVDITGETPNLMNAPNGTINYLWQDPTGTNPANIRDGNTLFEMCFNVLGDIGATSTVEVTALPNFQIEVANADGSALDFCSQGGSFVVIEDQVENCNTTDNPAFIINAQQGAENTTSPVCVPVTARNFTDMTSLMTNVTWDASVLQYAGVTARELTGESLTLANAANGSLGYTWADNSTTITDGATLFEVCFNVLGQEGETSLVSLEDIALRGPVGNIDATCTLGGTFTVTQEIVDLVCTTTPDPAFLVSGLSAPSGATSICVPINTRNFTGITALDADISWDPNVLQYVSATGNVQGAEVSTESANNGSITYSYSGSATTLQDNSELLEVCFNVIGAEGATTIISTDISNLVGPAGVIGRTCSDPGTLTVTQSTVDLNCNTTPDPSFIINGLSAPAGSTSICVPVTSRNFNSITAFSTDVLFDASVLRFAGINAQGISGETVSTEGANNGSINYSWTSAGVSITSGGTLFDICFDIIGDEGSSSTVDLDNISLSDNIGVIERTCDLASSITATESEAPFVNIIAGSVSAESGQEVCLPITASNFNSIQSAQFNLQWDESVVTYSRLIVADLPDFGSSSANFVDLNKLRVSWNPFAAVSLPDNSVLFQVCFDALPCMPEGSTNTTNIAFVDDSNIAIEVSNSSGEVVEVRSTIGAITVNCTTPQCVFQDIVNVSTISPPTCFGDMDGSFEATYIGEGTFTCTWRNSAGTIISTSSTDCGLTNLAAGTYSGTILTSDGCNLAFPTIEVPQPSRVAITSANNVSGDCNNGGFIDLTVEGGTLPYTYTWSPDLGNVEDPQNLGMGSYAVTVSDINGCSVTSSYSIGGPPDNTAPTLIAEEVTNRSCTTPTQGVNLEIEGGCAPITYTWVGPNGETRNTQDISNVEFGTWNVTISDMGGRTITRSYNLSDQIPPITISTDNITDASCGIQNSGSIGITVTGGCGDSPDDYNYLWNNTWTLEDLNQIAPGEYTLVVTDRVNPIVSATRTFRVGSGGEIFTVDSQVEDANNIEGDNGIVTLTIAGGSGDYSFEWNDGDQNRDRMGLSAGTYTVEVTDNATTCTQSITVVVESTAPPTLDLLSTGLTSCPGDEDGVIDGSIFGGCGGITLTVNGVTTTLPVIDLAPGEYIVEATDTCGVSVMEILTIADPAPIMIEVDTIACATTSDGFVSIDIVGGTGTFDINWSTGSPSDDNLSVSDLTPGNLTVIVEDENRCQAANQNIRIDDCNDMTVTDECSEYRTIISPNGDGLNDNLLIPCANDLDNQPNTLTIYDRWGRLVFQAENYDNQWLGTDNSGDLLDEGGYMWVLEIEAPEGRRIEKGTVTVLRSSY